MTSLSPSQRTQAEALLSMPARQIVDLLLVFWERPSQLPPHAINRTLDTLRAELRRRETQGFDDPFDSPYPEVTW